ncbi:glycosyltransferase family 2 protein [Seohaeicola sp. SP36]|uniref:glycosyltransferase family 2 protein n=1 Tax=unclassified Seohaeicola TaxID=2641111 RepID=UPI00237AA247|nr:MULTISPECIES: glycosyltransferase family 2 protein [unclassified Seohaeicola]MDD9709126.1 glycosyltransferase family 2 protein [Seohaeicola sp. 4SK31]MDD9737333.1 glycosyltransferase family 2 protein [Seohaeicola sp. SP36]
MGLVGRLKPLASRLRRGARHVRRRMFPDSRATLAVLAIMKNEGLNVDEWIDHYIWQGADHLFIIDNGSTDDTVARIENSAYRDRITLLHRPEPHRQGFHYRQTFRRERIRRRFQWLMVADADEFWFSAEDATLPAALARFDGFDVIYARWSQFGCPGQERHPASLRQALTLRHAALGPHKATKWVVRTSAIGNNALFIHKIRGACSSRTITDTDVMRVNHYMTQSLQFWNDVKMARGDASTPASDTSRTMAQFEGFNALSVVRDTELADRVAAAKATTSPAG